MFMPVFQGTPEKVSKKKGEEDRGSVWVAKRKTKNKEKLVFIAAGDGGKGFHKNLNGTKRELKKRPDLTVGKLWGERVPR